MTRLDTLELANVLDAAWHGQTKCFEREAITRFWGLLTLPARLLDPERLREMLGAATILRNARFKGEPVKGMFFADKDFTEVDALFLQVGSSLGHPLGEDAWVVEVERKVAHHQGDYYVAIQRAGLLRPAHAAHLPRHPTRGHLQQDRPGALQLSPDRDLSAIDADQWGTPQESPDGTHAPPSREALPTLGAASAALPVLA